MKVLISACLTGENCKYNGGNNRNESIMDYLKDKEIIAVCPEQLGGLETPRVPTELIQGVAYNRQKEKVDPYFREGTRKVLEKIKGLQIDCAILQSRSPSCGVKQIYDGTFTGKLVPGQGILAKALQDEGILLIDSDTLIAELEKKKA